MPAARVQPVPAPVHFASGGQSNRAAFTHQYNLLNASTFVTAAAWSYSVTVVAYLTFAVRMAIGSRANPRARLLLAATLATAAWAALCVLVVLQPGVGAHLAADVADVARYGAWYAFCGT